MRTLGKNRWVNWFILLPIQLWTHDLSNHSFSSPYMNLSTQAPIHFLIWASFTQSFLLGHFEVSSCVPPCTTAIIICDSTVLTAAEPTNGGSKPLKPNQGRSFLFQGWFPWVFCDSGGNLINTKEYLRRQKWENQAIQKEDSKLCHFISLGLSSRGKTEIEREKIRNRAGSSNQREVCGGGKMYSCAFLFTCVHIKEMGSVSSPRVSFQRCMCSLGRSGDIIFVTLEDRSTSSLNGSDENRKGKEEETDREKLYHGGR